MARIGPPMGSPHKLGTFPLILKVTGKEMPCFQKIDVW